MSETWIMSLNKDATFEPNHGGRLIAKNATLFGELPEHIKECFRALWYKGVVIEVFGVVSQTWQPITQCDMLLEDNKYYRLQGHKHAAVHKPIGSKGQWVHISDPVTLPELTVAYRVKDKAQAVTLTPYQN